MSLNLLKISIWIFFTFTYFIPQSTPAAIPSSSPYENFTTSSDYQHCLLDYLNEIGIISYTADHDESQYPSCDLFHADLNATMTIMYKVLKYNLEDSLDNPRETECLLEAFHHMNFLEYNVVATTAMQLESNDEQLERVLSISKGIFVYATVRCLITPKMLRDIFGDFTKKMTLSEAEYDCIRKDVFERNLLNEVFIADVDKFYSEKFNETVENFEKSGTRGEGLRSGFLKENMERNKKKGMRGGEGERIEGEVGREDSEGYKDQFKDSKGHFKDTQGHLEDIQDQFNDDSLKVTVSSSKVHEDHQYSYEGRQNTQGYVQIPQTTQGYMQGPSNPSERSLKISKNSQENHEDHEVIDDLKKTTDDLRNIQDFTEKYSTESKTHQETIENYSDNPMTSTPSYEHPKSHQSSSSTQIPLKNTESSSQEVQGQKARSQSTENVEKFNDELGEATSVLPYEIDYDFPAVSTKIKILHTPKPNENEHTSTSTTAPIDLTTTREQLNVISKDESEEEIELSIEEASHNKRNTKEKESREKLILKGEHSKVNYEEKLYGEEKSLRKFNEEKSEEANVKFVENFESPKFMDRASIKTEINSKNIESFFNNDKSSHINEESPIVSESSYVDPPATEIIPIKLRNIFNSLKEAKISTSTPIIHQVTMSRRKIALSTTEMPSYATLEPSYTTQEPSYTTQEPYFITQESVFGIQPHFSTNQQTFTTQETILAAQSPFTTEKYLKATQVPSESPEIQSETTQVSMEAQSSLKSTTNSLENKQNSQGTQATSESAQIPSENSKSSEISQENTGMSPESSKMTIESTQMPLNVNHIHGTMQTSILMTTINPQVSMTINGESIETTSKLFERNFDDGTSGIDSTTEINDFKSNEGHSAVLGGHHDIEKSIEVSKENSNLSEKYSAQKSSSYEPEEAQKTTNTEASNLQEFTTILPKLNDENSEVDEKNLNDENSTETIEQRIATKFDEKSREENSFEHQTTVKIPSAPSTQPATSAEGNLIKLNDEENSDSNESENVNESHKNNFDSHQNTDFEINYDEEPESFAAVVQEVPSDIQNIAKVQEISELPQQPPKPTKKPLNTSLFKQSIKSLADSLEKRSKPPQPDEVFPNLDSMIKKRDLSQKTLECPSILSSLTSRIKKYKLESFSPEDNECMSERVSEQDVDDIFAFVVMQKTAQSGAQKDLRNAKLMNLVISFVSKYVDCTDLYGLVDLVTLPED